MLRIMGILSLAVVVSGCGTMVNGSTQPIYVESRPSGAAVTVNGHHVGQTPCRVWMARSYNHTLRIEKEGYEPLRVPLRRRTSGWLLGNAALMWLFPVGLIVDFDSGGAWVLEPQHIIAHLRPDERYQDEPPEVSPPPPSSDYYPRDDHDRRDDPDRWDDYDQEPPRRDYRPYR
jgi:hypothetical protein